MALGVFMACDANPTLVLAAISGSSEPSVTTYWGGQYDIRVFWYHQMHAKIQQNTLGQHEYLSLYMHHLNRFFTHT